MDRKIRVIILTMVLTVLMFGGTRLMAEDNLDVNNTEASQTVTPKDEGNLEPMAKEGEEGESSVETDKNTDIDGNKANDDEQTGETVTTEPKASENGNTEVDKTETSEEAPKQEEKKPDAKKADKPADDSKAQTPDVKAAEKTAAGNGPEDGANPQAAPAKAPAPVDAQAGEGTKTTPEVDTSKDEELKALQEQIKAAENAKDDKKAAELKKQYADKLFKKVEDAGADKLSKEVLKRFTDKERTDEFYKLQEEFEALKKKAEQGKLTQEEVDKFNQKVGSFKPPRKLDSDEESAQKKLSDSVDVPGLQKGASDDAKAKLKAYNDAKEALQKALDADKTKGKAENLAELVKAFDDAEAALKEGIKNESIKPTYTDGKPTVRVFPLTNGSVGDELKQDPKKDAPYYIPDNTSIELLVHVNKDEEPKDFTFTIRAVDKGAVVEGERASNLAFLNGTPVDLVKNDDGSYSFTVSSKNMNFGIAQLRFNVPGFEGPFHKGFDLEMDLGKDDKGNDIKVTKQFRITKKGYEDKGHLSGPGSDTDEDPKAIPEIDAGKTENAVVDKDTDKVYDFFTYLEKSNTFIDEVTFNSGNGESLPLDSVDITITVPEHNGKFAEMIHKSGLEYYDLGNGKYQLKLNTKVFGKNLTKTEDGKLMVGDKELTAATLKDVVLENASKKVYLDDKGKAHDIITSEVLADEKGDYKVEGGKLYKKNKDDQSKFDEIGTFDKDGKIETKDKTYVLDGNNLITYTSEHDVYDGYVTNEGDKANTDVTPTYEGKQVTIETEVEKDGETKTETSYGGTIVKDAIYDKNGKIFKETGYKGIAGEVAIGPDGKIAEGLFFDPSSIDTEKQTIEVDGKVFRIVKNPVFNKDGYIIDGLEYKTGLSLIDKFGKKMDIGITKDEVGKYTFTRKVAEDKYEKVESGENIEKKRKVIVADTDGQILVNSKNEVVKNDNTNKNPYEIVGPKYYYDGKKFVKADGNGLKVNKFLEGLEEIKLKESKKYSYLDGDKTTEIKNFGTKTVYEGSLDPKDYFEAGDKVYVKKGDIYISAKDGESSDILTEKTIAKIVQTLGEGDKAIEKVTAEADIFNAIQNARFGLRFPGFLAGKNIVYNVNAEVKATYKEPSKTEEGKFEEKSIFTSEKDETKKIDKFFTLKNEKKTNTNFFKNAPEALTKNPEVNLHFFNIFYRNADDRVRDQLIADLLEIEEKVNKAEKAVEEAPKADKKAKQEAYEELKKENKEKLELLAKFKYEFGRVKNGAKFIIKIDEKKDQTDGPVYVKNKEGKTKLFIVGEDGKEIEADELNKMRSLLWEIGFENTEGSLFPENPDTEIIIEDHNMDNRLIYDEIIVNDTKENWKKAKEEFEAKDENKDKKFGNEEYFFLDQIKDIRFGVSPNYIEGRFVPLGEKFKITGQEIIDELNKDTNAESVEIEKGVGNDKIKFLITRDKVNGQIRIKVMNAFYKKVEKDSTHKFESPVQEAYQKKIDGLLDKVDELSENNIDEFVKTIHDESSECFGIIKEKLTEEFKKVKDNSEELKKFKADLKAEIKKIELKYLDSKKGDYKYDDMRFNAIRIGLKPNITIGGAMTPQNIKKLGITSVIIPEIDIPYTDEFGDLLTNKDKYVKEEIANILKNGIGEGKDKKTYKKDDLKNEEKFREIMAEAYKRVNAKIDSKDEAEKITIKKLVTIEEANKKKVGMEKYTVTKGSELKYADLAVNDQSLKNKDGFAINPWYIGESKNAETIEDRFKVKFADKYKDMAEYKELKKMSIDISAYYMSKQGYDRSRFANQANYKLAGGDKKDGIFGSDSDWHKKICYPGIGHCIEQAGKDSTSDKKPEAGKFGTEGQNGADFGLTYEHTNKGPDKENPKTDKKSDKESIDISDEKEEKEVDFTIDVTVDKMTKEQRDIADALTPKKDEKDMTDEEKEKAKADEERKKIEDKNFKDNGYYEYKKSLIIDFLPEVFKLKEGTTKLIFTADRKKLMENGANKEFADEEVFKKWQEGIEYFHTDDLLAYAETLTDKEKAEVLKKAIDEAIKDGKIKEGQKVQAVLAWVPTFEAPHGSEKQFTIKLEKLIVNKKKFKDFNDGIIGTNYTNHAAFGDKAKFYFGSTTVNIHKDKYGKVNKYLQVLDKDGEAIDKDKADGWFMGNAELKFGDKFNYRIEYKNDNSIVQVPGEAHTQSEIKIADLFAKVSDKGLRPVLNGFITSDLEKYEVIYKIGDKEYSETELKAKIKANKVKISDVTSVILKGNFDNGATKHFDIPMMIPNFDAKVEDGKVYYIGQDDKKHEIGEAKDFFNLKDLTDKGKDLIAENKVKDSNTVTVYLDKERFIRVFKEFLAANGEKLKNLDNLEAKFDVYQIIEENGKKTRVKLDKQLIVNKDNDFTDMIDHLPIFKKTTTIDEKGNVTVSEVKYEYELEEAAMPGFESKVYQMKDDDDLGFVWQAKNTEKPENPGDHPNEEPKEVKVTIRVNKVWKVLNGGSTPSIKVQLYANGEPTDKFLTLGNGNWSAEFKDLPAKDKDGKDIVYTVVEVGETNYLTEIGKRKFEVSYDIGEDGSITITNTEKPEEPNDEEPKDKEEPKKDEPHDDEEERDHDQGNNKLPKTGVAEDLASIYFAFVLLLGLVFIKKRYLVK